MNRLDLAEIGSLVWRRRVLAVPQADHDHLIPGTLAMNLLIGRRWPATPDELGAAERVCRAIGLAEWNKEDVRVRNRARYPGAVPGSVRDSRYRRCPILRRHYVSKALQDH